METSKTESANRKLYFSENYQPDVIEPRWQRAWEEAGLFRTTESDQRSKYYCLDFFPYPSGEGLHVGHCRNYIPTDVISRYQRMRGYQVLHPMGWDSFGEPTEQFAILHNVHPRVSTDQNTTNFRRQMTMIGTSYDWEREIDSSRPEFYRWTQWFFLLLYRRGLAYRDTNWQWWCPDCQTTLSSHEAVGGVCWRGHSGVTKREIPAWYFRITAYADQLLAGLEDIDWPEPIKIMQRNWIGRSEGAEIKFPLETHAPAASEQVYLPVFTTRPDTLFGVTFLVLAPEHPMVAEITSDQQRAEVEAYISRATGLSEIERLAEARSPEGVFTGGYGRHPVSGERLPVWVADYVLPSYGSGAIIGVPAHDERDYQFAQQYRLPVRQVISPPAGLHLEWTMADSQAYSGEGELINSGEFNGIPSQQAREQITEFLHVQGLGRTVVHYRMRDWLISRQRYWGTPIPIVHCQECGEVPVPEERLPVLLPDMDDFRPDGSGRSPLARLPDFVNTTCPSCHGPARRETDTMGGFACSSWYFLRFTSPHYTQGPFDPQAMRYWMPVDLYVGGAEHAVLHLLYARFWMHVLADEGLSLYREPFTRLLNQGQLRALDRRRMSKSRGNVITPDEIVATYGADALRVYILFMAPFEQDVDWSEQGIQGARRFLNRVWDLYARVYSANEQSSGEDGELQRLLHKTIRRVSERIQSFRFNTAVSALMEFFNALSERLRLGTWHTRDFYLSLETLLVLMAPIAPHIAEELWVHTGHAGSIHRQPWPEWDDQLAQDEYLHLPVQVDGRLRAVIEVPVEAEEAEVREAALSTPKVSQHLDGREVIKVIYVAGKVFSILSRARKSVIEGE